MVALESRLCRFRDWKRVAGYLRGGFRFLSESEIRYDLVAHHGRVLLFEEFGQFVGVAILIFRPGKVAWLERVLVTPRYQRQGYGLRVILQTERECRRVGCTALGLAVFEDNAPAIHLYERAGYHLNEIKLGKRGYLKELRKVYRNIGQPTQLPAWNVSPRTHPLVHLFRRLVYAYQVRKLSHA